jgi:hypothetical protein
MFNVDIANERRDDLKSYFSYKCRFCLRLRSEPDTDSSDVNKSAVCGIVAMGGGWDVSPQPFRRGRFTAAVSPPALSPRGRFAAAVSPPFESHHSCHDRFNIYRVCNPHF